MRARSSARLLQGVQVQINKIINMNMTDIGFAGTMDKYTLSEVRGALTFVSHI